MKPSVVEELKVARKIFKASEVKEIGSKVLIAPPVITVKKPPEVEPVQPEPEVEELTEVEIEEEPSLEVEDERQRILDEARKIKEEAEEEARRIKKEAEEEAVSLIEKSNADAQKLREEAQQEAGAILEEAKAKAAAIENEAQKKVAQLENDARSRGYEEGKEEGFKRGEEEVKRLIDRLHVILNAAIDKRQEIIDHTEGQLIDLVLLIARKVVKLLSEAEKGIVVENVKQALSKVKGETEIIIKVNTRDLDIATKHKKEFIAAVESLKNVRIEEDSRVDPGGCIIETSFGSIDARIQRQLGIIEERIRELLPINKK
jgi:flagellar assembly protein FliH